MASSASPPNQQLAVVFPSRTKDNAPDVVEREWPSVSPLNDDLDVVRDDPPHVAEQGFLFISMLFQEGITSVLQIQSPSTRVFLANKLIRGGPEDRYDEPLELRVSNWPGAQGVLPTDAPFFNQLRFFQELNSNAGAPVYSLFFEYVTLVGSPINLEKSPVDVDIAIIMGAIYRNLETNTLRELWQYQSISSGMSATSDS